MNVNKAKTRALRLHRQEQVKRRAAQRLQQRQGRWSRLADIGSSAVGKLAATPASCSCPMCGNPRRSPLCKGSERLSLQERRARKASVAD